MTLPPLTHIIGRTLGYAIIAVLLPLLSLAFIISAIVTAATWAWRWSGDWKGGGDEHERSSALWKRTSTVWLRRG